MLDHVGFPVTDDIKRSIAFYKAALAPLGIMLIAKVPPKMTSNEGHHAGFDADQKAFFWISTGKPLKGRLHVAFAAKDRTAVTALYDAAIKAGGPITTRITSAPSSWIRTDTMSKPSAAYLPRLCMHIVR